MSWLDDTKGLLQDLYDAAQRIGGAGPESVSPSAQRWTPPQADVEYLKTQGIKPGQTYGEWTPMNVLDLAVEGDWKRLGKMGANYLEDLLRQPQHIVEAMAGPVPIRDKRGRVVTQVEVPSKRFAPPLTPIEQSQADIPTIAADILTPGPGEAGVFPRARPAYRNLKAVDPKMAEKLLAEAAELRGVEADLLSRAHNTWYAKGTRMGDLNRQLMYSENPTIPAVVAAREGASPAESGALGGTLMLLGMGKAPGSFDRAVKLKIAAHEFSHINWQRIVAAADAGDKDAQFVRDVILEAIRREPFRAPGSEMSAVVLGGQLPGVSIPHLQKPELVKLMEQEKLLPSTKPHPGGRMIEEAEWVTKPEDVEQIAQQLGLSADDKAKLIEEMKAGRMEGLLDIEHRGRLRESEQVSDLMAKTLTWRGWEELQPETKELMKLIMRPPGE